ncbi:GFA family protein, partial [Frateuria defendens]|uniref:GFA family protein n=1 Tax=Frateuria defendens TaxID=2219559 RepID=UPI001929F19F
MAVSSATPWPTLPLRCLFYCHCSNCRRATGSAFKPFAGIGRDRLAVTEGEESLMFYGDETAHDAHCKHCGSLLYSVVREGAYVHVAMGTLLDEPSIRPTHHIFVGSKAAWFTIADDLPQYEAHAVCPIARRLARHGVDAHNGTAQEPECATRAGSPRLTPSRHGCRL